MEVQSVHILDMKPEFYDVRIFICLNNRERFLSKSEVLLP